MHLIGTIAGNTPYVGLLGTVLGIMMTFHTISTSSHMETEAIMVGLSLALKATAIGLVVAIIAVALYNLLVRNRHRPCPVSISGWKWHRTVLLQCKENR